MSHFRPEFETLIAPGFNPLKIDYENVEESLDLNIRPIKNTLESQLFHGTLLDNVKTRQSQVNDKENNGSEKNSW